MKLVVIALVEVCVIIHLVFAVASMVTTVLNVNTKLYWVKHHNSLFSCLIALSASYVSMSKLNLV